MKTSTNRRTRFGIAAVTVAAATLTTLGVGTASAAAAPPAHQAAPVVAATAKAPIKVSLAAPAKTAAMPVNYVKVSDALLRSQPNTRSTKLDVSQYGRGVDLYCWVDYTDTSRYVWFYVHPWGSRYTGYMRADLIHWGSYPNPGRC
ncbi:hypothetical protein [Actinokineospora enzanensis]|uniref:hypothetical protein n=1 Tax=Actinokineospora enzanensis TaxID=155975 RepID=UPI000377745B|nr:hypothetical protein [Actinokineospora enzanensis]